ncbi:hypothetical protein [Saccharopolyspora soli]|nr:hypothetical protein [Saccharopolyspora soli]
MAVSAPEGSASRVGFSEVLDFSEFDSGNYDAGVVDRIIAR